MSDLISSLAGQIVALINSSPRSPTKEELQEVLSDYLFVVDDGTALYKLPGQKCKSEWPLPPKDADLSEATLLQACIAIDGIRDCQGEAAPRQDVVWAYGQPSSVLMVDAQSDPVKVTWFSALRAYADWAPDPTAGSVPVMPLPYKEDVSPPELMARIDAATVRRLTPTGRGVCKCPGSTDGSHLWQRSHYYNDERCACGAVKP